MGDQLYRPKGTVVSIVKYIKRLVPKYHLPDTSRFAARYSGTVCGMSKRNLSLKIWLSCNTGIYDRRGERDVGSPPQYGGESGAGGDLWAAAAPGKRAVVTALPLCITFCLNHELSAFFIELGGQTC